MIRQGGKTSKKAEIVFRNQYIISVRHEAIQRAA
jgi:hypothetical protein